jgi:hypothetical protein
LPWTSFTSKNTKTPGTKRDECTQLKKKQIHAAHRDRRCPKSRYAALRPALRPPVAVRDTHFLPATVCRGVTSPSIAPALRIHPSLLPLSLALSLLPSLPPSLAQRHPSELTAPPHTIDFPSTYSARQRATARDSARQRATARDSALLARMFTRTRTRTRTRCGVCVCKRTQECCHMHSARAPPGPAGWSHTCPWGRRDRALSSRGTQA